MDFRIFIDETGNFALKTKKKANSDYVAGWVSVDLTDDKLKSIINNALWTLNETLLAENPKSKAICVPQELHFMPLHIKSLRIGPDEGLLVPVEVAPQIVRSIFKAVEPYTRFIFRSRGFPHFYANEQGAYSDILRATILQVVDSIGYLPDDRIEICSASRRIRELLGEYGFSNRREYEQKFCETIVQEINFVFDRRRINHPIIVEIQNARNDIGLAVADFVCGSFRWSDYDYLSEFPECKIKSFNIHNAFVYISKRRISQIGHLFESDPAQALLQAFCHLSSNSSDHEINLLTDSLIQKCKRWDLLNFASLLKVYLHEQIVENPFRYQCLAFIEGLLDSIQPRIIEDHVQATIQSCRIKLTGHRGDIDLKTVSRYLEFLDEKGPLVFGSRYLSAQEKIETILSAVQPVAFNRFKFEDVEDYLIDEYKRYLSTFSNSKSEVDETLARLEGSIGQMYGFLCDYPGQDAYFEEALNYINLDIARCEKNSPRWRQGMGYLTTLHFKRGDLENAIKSFLYETGCQKSPANNIFDLAQYNAFGSFKDDFFQLHRLYICALARKKGLPITGLEKFREKFLHQNFVNGYPRFLSGKWLSILFFFNEDIKTAINLVEHCLGSSKSTFTLKVIKISLEILDKYYKIKLGIDSSYDLKYEIQELEKQVNGISENLKRLEIEMYYEFNENWDPFKIASIMPFYFS